jgi:hypothetical protein
LQEPVVRTPSTGNFSPSESASEPTEADEPREGRSKTLPDVAGRPAPRLPHERDESSDSGVGAPSDVMQRAHDDAASGKTGTDKGEATDAVYRRSLRDSTPGSERD